MTRLHTLRKGNFMLWADHVPVMHGMANLFTLWRLEAGRWQRLIGGVQMHTLRQFVAEQVA